MGDDLTGRRRATASDGWLDAGGGRLHHMLGPGWSGRETWGVWGIGPVHEFLLPVPDPLGGDIELDADVEVVLLGSLTSQLVDILVAGRRVATWNFVIQANRSVRSMRIPAAVVAGAVDADGDGMMRIEFRPHSATPPHELDPANAERRPLGLGLHRIRWQVAGSAEWDSSESSNMGTTTEPGKTGTAAITFVYNESVNLPIWISYFGKLFGNRNLFVIDRGSTDGSTDNLGEVNVLRVPRGQFDEFQKTGIINSLQNGLMNYFETVIYTDCDELVVPNLSIYADLNDYLARTAFDHMSCVGLNIQHVLTIEDPLDLAKPILAQRRFAKFWSSSCKTAITRVPLTWANGMHHCDRRPQIDPELFMIHTKWMDYSLAMLRQKINRDTLRSERGVAGGLGDHWSYDSARFVREGFLDMLNVMGNNALGSFDFAAEIAEIDARTIEIERTYLIPMDIVKYVELPNYLRAAF